MNNVKFKDRSFNYCFDCGWGEKGVHNVGLTYAQAFDIIKSLASEESALRWAKEEDNYWEFRVDYYMVADCEFHEDDWEGSQDY